MRKLLIFIFIMVMSCQKDYYLEDLTSATDEISSLKDTILELTNENNDLQSENSDLLSQISLLEDNVVALQQETESLEDTIAADAATISDLEEYVSALKESLSFVTSQYEATLEQLSSAEALLVEGDKEHEEHLNRCSELIEQQSALIESLHEQIEEMNSQIATAVAASETPSIATDTTVHDSEINTGVDHTTTTDNTLQVATTTEEEETTTIEVSLTSSDLGPLRPIAPSSDATGFFSDAVYGTIDFDDPNSYLEAFVMDAERYGVDIRFALDQVFTFQWFNKSAGQSDAYAYLCIPESIFIQYDIDSWDGHTSGDQSNQRLRLMWHEFGHAILEYNHSCDHSSIMYSHNSCVGDILPFSGVVSSWDDFPTAAKNLFESYNIQEYPCGYSSKGSNGNIID